MAETTPAPAAEQPAPTDENKDVMALVAGAEKPAEPAKPAEKETTETDPPVDEAVLTPEEVAAAKQTEGTPNKSLQKVQQDLSTILRQQTELNERFAAGETPTGKERQQLQQNQRKIDAIRASLAENKFDLYGDGSAEALAASLVETDDDVGQLRKEVGELLTEVRASKADSTWKQLGMTYEGVDVKTLWTKARSDATGLVGADNPALDRVANEYFHSRAKAAAASVKAKRKDDPSLPEVPVTAGGARTTQNNLQRQPVTPTQDEQEMRAYMALVKT